MQVVVPVKGESTRCPNKNFREFVDGKSLLEIKIEQLLTVFEPRDVFISSDSGRAKEMAGQYCVNFVWRDERDTKPSTPTSDYFVRLFDILSDADDLAQAFVTAPLFTDFPGALQAWESQAKPKGCDSLIAVRPYQHFLVDERAVPINFQYGRWHTLTQDLPKWYQLDYSFFIITREAVQRCAYNVGERPYLFVGGEIGIDIDTEYEFTLAQLAYERFVLQSP